MLKINQISKIYANSHAGLHACSFELQKGQCLAVVGESGSGKTTLLQILAGFLPTDFGEMRLHKKLLPSPADMLVKGYPDLQLVPQDFKLLPNHRVWENITLPIRHYAADKQAKRLAYLSELLGLKDLLERYPRELSGGQQQRTAIARALSSEPAVLLLDEPFNQADTKTKQKLVHALAYLKKKDKTAIVLVTHDAQEALGLADALLVLQAGKTLQCDTPTQIYTHPTEKYIAELFGYINYFPKNKQSEMAVRAEHTFFSPTPTELQGEIIYKFYYGHSYRYVVQVGKHLLWEVYDTTSLPEGKCYLAFHTDKLMRF